MAKTLISGRQKIFSEFYLYLLDIVPSYHPMQFKGKLMNQTRENKEKLNFGSDFGLFDPNLGSKNFFVGFNSTSSWTWIQAIILCNLKKN